MDGQRANVRVSRQDVVQRPADKDRLQQIFALRQGNAWRIQSIGQ
jgi:hypothetical protein